jgi:4-hydroxyphenylpyruvate dioxygenase
VIGPWPGQETKGNKRQAAMTDPAFKTSIATVSISGTLEAKLQAIAAAGYDGAEIFENDLLSTHLSAREIAAMMGDLGLVCTMFQPFRDLDGLPEPQRARAFDRLERKFDVMQELGTDLLLVCSSCSPIADGDRERTIADLTEAAERAAARGLRLGYEALAWGRHVHDHREAWGIVRDADHPALGLVLDRSTRCRARFHRPSAISAPTSCSSCRWPTRRCWTWITSAGAAISARCRAGRFPAR